MEIATGASEGLVIALYVLLALAAIEDAWRLRISNIIVLGVALSAIAAMVDVAIGWQAWQPVVLAIAILAAGTPMFAAGWLGGGDVKLLAASSLWFMLDGGWKMLVAVALVGGLLTMIVIIIRLVGLPDAVRSRVAMLRKGGGIPYGIAVTIGVAGLIATSR